MLGKVLKYDIKALSRYLIPLYAVILGLSLMIRILSLFDDVSIIAIVLGLMILALVFAVGFSFLLTGIFNIKYYLENLFKDEAYLTHTLPVKKGTLLLSKVLACVIIIIMTFICVLFSLLIAFYKEGFFSEIFKILGESYAGMEIYKFVLYMGIYGIIGYLTTILMVYAAISIGHSKSSNKIVSSVIWGLIFYFGIEFLNLGLLFIVMAAEPSFIMNLENNTFMMSDLLNFFTIFMVFIAILGGIFYYISYRFMSKRLNLE